MWVNAGRGVVGRGWVGRGGLGRAEEGGIDSENTYVRTYVNAIYGSS